MQEILTKMMEAFTEYAPVVGGAIIILLVGWILALVLAGVTRSIIKKTGLQNKLSGVFNRESNDTPPDVPTGAGRFVFWTVMVLTMIAVFQVLDLTMLTTPLGEFANELFGYLPQLIGAGILLLLAWIIAKLVKLLATKILQSTSIDDKLSSHTTSDDTSSIPFSKTIGDILYWLVFLLFLPAILDALAMQGLLEPVQSMMNKFLSFLPNIVGALIIGLVGWFIARIVQRIVSSLLAAAGADKLTEKYNLAPLSKIIGMVVYVLILIPILISALNALQLDAITGPASAMLASLFAALPNIFAAGIILAIGFFLGRFISGIVTNLLAGIGFDALAAKVGLSGKLNNSENGLSKVVGHIVFIIVLLFSFFEATSMLGFDALSTIITELTVFGGHLLFGLIILFIGLFLSNVAADTIRKSSLQNASFIAQLARIVILLIIGSMAIRQMGIANEIINMAFGMTLGAAAIAAAIAFGIGGREFAAKKLNQWSNKLQSENQSQS